ncbi:MAG TPA: hypothetical protein PK784_05740 [Tenuifilaceae bacterium]|nr:hypothetical protein [Tenuifilaceae bacterium]HPN22297.1 hypothetical protein [Tenuifilaceae bacterium]
MTEKELRELIAINLESIDYVTIVASKEDLEYKMNYGWNGMEFKVLIVSSKSSNVNYSTKSIQPIFRDFTEIINQNELKINYITYVLNLEYGIFILNHYDGKEVAYTFKTQMLSKNTLNVLFCPVKEIISYAEASANFNLLVNSLKVEYNEFKIEISSPTPKELCRQRKLQKIFLEY